MYTRGNDIYELKRARKEAKNAFERSLIDKTLTKIYRENKTVEGLRQKLTQAVRGDSQRAIKYYSEKLISMRGRNE